MSMTKKILFTILIIVVIIAFGLIAYQYSGDKPENEVQKNTETEGDDEKNVGYVPPTDQSQAEIASIVDEAIRNLDMSLCEKIKDTLRANECKQDIDFLK